MQVQAVARPFVVQLHKVVPKSLPSVKIDEEAGWGECSVKAECTLFFVHSVVVCRHSRDFCAHALAHCIQRCFINCHDCKQIQGYLHVIKLVKHFHSPIFQPVVSI